MLSELNVIADYQRHLRGMELSDLTIVDYTRILNRLNGWLMQEYSTDFSDPNTVKGYMISMYCTSIQNLKIATRTLQLTVIKAFLKWLHALQYTDHDLSAAVPKLPTIEKYNAAHPEQVNVKRGYTPDEIKAMLTAVRHSSFICHRDRAIIATMLSTGLRVSELLALRVGDVIAEPEFIHVPRKGTHGQKVPVAIAPVAFPYIMRYIEEREKKITTHIDDALWVMPSGKPMDRHEVAHSLAALQKKLGIPTGTHTLRHTMITEVTKQSNPIVARDAAGQKSISVTNRYLHSTQDEIREAVILAGLIVDVVSESDLP